MLKLYTQIGCPQCKMVHMLLDKKQIPYQEFQDIEEMKKLGITHTPAIEINGKILQGKDMMTYINTYSIDITGSEEK